MDAGSFVDAGVVIKSKDDVAKLVGKANSEHREFAKKVVEANLNIVGGYQV